MVRKPDMFGQLRGDCRRRAMEGNGVCGGLMGFRAEEVWSEGGGVEDSPRFRASCGCSGADGEWQMCSALSLLTGNCWGVGSDWGSCPTKG